MEGAEGLAPATPFMVSRHLWGTPSRVSLEFTQLMSAHWWPYTWTSGTRENRSMKNDEQSGGKEREIKWMKSRKWTEWDMYTPFALAFKIHSFYELKSGAVVKFQKGRWLRASSRQQLSQNSSGSLSPRTSVLTLLVSCHPLLFMPLSHKSRQLGNGGN